MFPCQAAIVSPSMFMSFWIPFRKVGYYIVKACLEVFFYNGERGWKLKSLGPGLLARCIPKAWKGTNTWTSQEWNILDAQLKWHPSKRKAATQPWTVRMGPRHTVRNTWPLCFQGRVKDSNHLGSYSTCFCIVSPVYLLGNGRLLVSSISHVHLQ